MVDKRGFTLIELSIVIVILGLIVAGVFAGQSLVEQARLRQVITDVKEISAAVRTFQSRYGGLPGDIAGYEYFGSRCGEDAPATSASGCNGNGNRFVQARMANGGGYLYETRLAWRHLEAAGYIKQKFYHSYNDSNLAERAYKASSIDDAVFSINSIGYPGGYGTLGDGYFAHATAVAPKPRTGLFIGFGKPYNAISIYDLWRSANMSAQMAHSIDVKIDDGVAQTGGVLTNRSEEASAGQCGPHRTGTTSAGNASDYVLVDETRNCRMSFEVE